MRMVGNDKATCRNLRRGSENVNVPNSNFRVGVTLYFEIALSRDPRSLSREEMNKTSLLVPILLFSGVVPLGAATQSKFRPSSVGGAGVGRYVVTVTEEAGFDDPAALRKELALIYGAKLDVNASADARQFAVTMTSARARLLSTDPRVTEVVEFPLTTPAPSQTTASSAHLKSRPTGYGDNGQSGTYTYDGAGNITSIGADTFVYDSAQRLVISVTRGVQENYTYDAYGNRTSATGAVNCLGQTNCAQSVTVDPNTNHLTTINGAAVTYDAAGNIKTIAATSGSPGAVYSYDALGMMTEATVGSDIRQFLYTADDERIAIRQGVSWTWMIRDQRGKVLREFTSLESGSGPNLTMTNRQWAKDYVWRDGLLLATVSPSGTLHYHLDHLGTPRLITDSNGVKVAEHAYYPFGAEINLMPHENPEEAMKFTGHERDLVAGDGHTLDYMHARYYAASLGRFLSVDPSEFWQVRNDDGAGQEKLRRQLKRPQVWNRYPYVSNSPMNATDPDGRETYLITTFDYGVGTHSAVLVARNGDNVLFDPAGSYVPSSVKKEGGQRGSGDVFEGKDANLRSYVDFQKSTGSDVKVLKFNTTPGQEATIKARIEQQPGIAPGFCAVATSTVISGVGPFKEVKPMSLPGRLYAKLKDLLTQ
jgi:RHS repeat-associated protein